MGRTLQKGITKEYIEQFITVNGGLKSTILQDAQKTAEELYLIYHNIEQPVNEFNQKLMFINFKKGYSEKGILSKTDIITKEYIEKNLLYNGNIASSIFKKIDKTSEELYLIFHDIVSKPCCQFGNTARYDGFKKGYSILCSNKKCNCSAVLRYSNAKKTIADIENYYVDIVKATKRTKQLRYNNPNYVNVDKMKATFIKKANNDLAYSSSRLHMTNLEHYNRSYILEHFISDNVFLLKEMCDFYNISISYGNKLKQKYKIKEKNKREYIFKENEINKFFNDIFRENDRRIIYPMEIDLVSDEYKLGIEYDGLMWHSSGISVYSKFNNPNKICKHLMKTDKLESIGFQLFHIFENEWLDNKKQLIWKSIISNKLNMNQTIIKTYKIEHISLVDAKQFLDINHLEGFISANVFLGCISNEELLSIISFKKIEENIYDITQICTKCNHVVLDGYKEIEDIFVNKYHPNILLGSSNRRWDNGSIFEELNFDFIQNSKPTVFFFRKPDYVLYTESEISMRLETIDDTLSLTENAFRQNFRKILDSGNKYYRKELRK